MQPAGLRLGWFLRASIHLSASRRPVPSCACDPTPSLHWFPDGTAPQEAAEAIRILGPTLRFSSGSNPRPVGLQGKSALAMSVCVWGGKGVAIFKSQSFGCRRLQLPYLWGSFYLGLLEQQWLGERGGVGSDSSIRLGGSWLAWQLPLPSASGLGWEPHLCPLLLSL